MLLLQIRAKNQLRVNGLGFGLYYGSFFTVLGTMCLVLCAALLILIQVRKEGFKAFSLI